MACPGRAKTLNMQNWSRLGQVKTVNVLNGLSGCVRTVNVTCFIHFYRVRLLNNQNLAYPGRAKTLNVKNWSCPGQVSVSEVVFKVP